MNYKLHAFTWPVILAFLPALFGGLGQNLQQIFNFGPASSSSVAQVSQAKATADSITVTTICFSSQGDINEGNQPRFGLITDKMIKQTVTLSKNTKTNLWSATAKQPNGAIDSEPVVKIVGANNKNLYSHYRSSDHQMVLALCNGAVGPLKVDLGWSKDPQACPEGQIRDATGNCVLKPCPEGQVRDDSGKCVPDPNPCYKSTWTCGAWRTCTSAGIQTRSCTGKAVRSACPSTSEPKPTSTQACTPPVKKVNIFAPKGDTFTSKDLPLLFQAQVKNADGSNDTSTHTFNWLADGGQAQTEKVSGSSYQPTLSAGEHTITVTADPDTWKLTDSKKVTIKSGCADQALPKTVQENIQDLIHGQYTRISADSFQQWADENSAEIYNEMDRQQTCYLMDFNNTNFQIIYGDRFPSNVFAGIKKKIKNYLDRGYPSLTSYTIYLRGYSQGKYRVQQLGSHAVIATRLTDQSGVIKKKFILEVIDSNIPGKDTLTCEVSSLYDNKGDYDTNLQIATICRSSRLSPANLMSPEDLKKWSAFFDHGKYELVGFLKDDITSSLTETNDDLIHYRNLACQQHPSSSLCNKSVLDKIRTDYSNVLPNINTPSNRNGICKGWSKFNLQVAFLGDFVGKCKTP